VGDPQDLALEVVLAAVGRDAELAQDAGDLASVDAAGQLSRPSSAIICSATSSPKNSETAGVNGLAPPAWLLAVLAQSK
jgi:hypothetical protein